MAFVPVKQVGQFGVNRDLSTSELPINAWTDCQNIRFLDGSAYQFYGHGEIYAGTAVEPYHVLPVTVGGVKYWLYAGANKIYQVGAPGGVITHTNITRQTASVDVDYTATRNKWTSTVLGGIPILNNGVDAPQQHPLLEAIAKGHQGVAFRQDEVLILLQVVVAADDAVPLDRDHLGFGIGHQIAPIIAVAG